MFTFTSFDPHFLSSNCDQHAKVSAKFENIISKGFRTNLNLEKY